MPKVSVCIPTLNAEKFIKQAIFSVYNQDYIDYEIIVVDNCSSDNTKYIIRELMDKFGNIKFFENLTNLGLAENLNKCIKYSQGEYIKFLCVDDILLSGCIKKMVCILDSHPNVSLVCSSRLNIDNFGNCFAVRGYSYFTRLENGFKSINKCFFGGNFIGEPTATMFRKKNSQNGFRNDLPQLMDMEMWFRLLENGDLYFLKEALCSIRIHEDQMTRQNIKRGILIKDNIFLYDQFINKKYIKKNIFNILKHKFLMTYRFWISKDYIENHYLKQKLKIYGLKNLFLLMSLIYYFRSFRRFTIITFKKIFYNS